MNPPLRREQAERVLPADAEGGALYAGLLALGVFDDLCPEAPALCPAPVHPGEHLGPILGVHAPFAGVYGEDGIALVVLPAREPRHLLLLENPLNATQLLLDLGEEFSILVSELEPLLGVGEALHLRLAQPDVLYAVDVGDVVLLESPLHLLEDVEALAFVLDERVPLAQAPPADAFAQVVHLVEMLAPAGVNHREQGPALGLLEGACPVGAREAATLQLSGALLPLRLALLEALAGVLENHVHNLGARELL